MGSPGARLIQGLVEDLAILRPGEAALGPRALDALEQIGITMPHAYSLDQASQGLESFVGRHFDVARLRRLYIEHWSDLMKIRAYHPHAVQRAQRNRALLTHELRISTPNLYALRAHWRTVVFDMQDQLRTIICDGPAMLAWVGGFSQQDFTKAEARRLQQLTPVFAKRLKREALVRDADLNSGALEAVLEALPRPSLIVDHRLRPVHRNGLARNVVFEATKAKLTLILAPGLPRHFLAELPGARAVAIVPAAARRFSLTAQEARVLTLLLRGTTNRAISVVLGCTERTVEAHVSRLLHKSHSARRGELLAKLVRG